jgi:urease accessory protein
MKGDAAFCDPASRDPAAWTGRLALVFGRNGDRSVLASRRHEGPLVVQRPLYPEGHGVCHAVVVHAPGGIAGGDALSLGLTIEAGAHAVVTTPAATKWYKAADRAASQTGDFAVAAGGVLEWLPLESIVFDAADAAIVTRVGLAADAAYAGWEIVCLGRRASGEAFRHGAFRQVLEIRRDGRLIWNDRIVLRGGDPMLRSPVGMATHHVTGALVVAGVGAPPPDLVECCRELAPADGEGRVTVLPDIISARYLGGVAENARNYFEQLRTVLRPWYAGRPAQRLRLWDT